MSASAVHDSSTVSDPREPGDCITVRLSETLQVPKGTVVLTSAASGAVFGLRLPSGAVLKPWITYELARDEAGVEVNAPLDYDALCGREVWEDLDLTREIDGVDGDLPTEAASV